MGREGTVEEIMDANERFHEIIVQASGNSLMIDTISRMKSIIYLFRKTVVLYNRPRLIDEHEEIYEAIKARDGEKALTTDGKSSETRFGVLLAHHK